MILEGGRRLLSQHSDEVSMVGLRESIRGRPPGSLQETSWTDLVATKASSEMPSQIGGGLRSNCQVVGHATDRGP